MGGSFGTALFGAILTSRLAVHLVDAAQSAGARGIDTSKFAGVSNNAEAIRHLSEPAHTIVTTAFSEAMSDMFLVAVPLVLAALVIGLFLEQIPLKAREPEVTEEAVAPDLV
jgi:hypothetical protein